MSDVDFVSCCSRLAMFPTGMNTKRLSAGKRLTTNITPYTLNVLNLTAGAAGSLYESRMECSARAAPIALPGKCRAKVNHFSGVEDAFAMAEETVLAQDKYWPRALSQDLW